MTDQRGIVQRSSDWVAAGLITEDQADAIAAYEGSSDRVAPVGEPIGPDSRAALVVEVLGYLGGALALAAVAFLVAQMWDTLDDVAQLLVVAIATAALLVAGAFLRLAQQAPLRRLARFLWFLAIGGVAATTALLVPLLFPGMDHGEDIALVAASVSLVAALPLWWFERRALQQVAVFVALDYVVLLALLDQADFSTSVFSWIAWAIGLVWLAMSYMGWLQPRKTGYALGSIAVLLSPQMAVIEAYDASVLMLGLGVVSALALLGTALLTEERLFLGFGAAGILIYVPQITFEVFGDDTLAVPIVLLVTGLSLIAVAVIYARMRKGARLRDPSV